TVTYDARRTVFPTPTACNIFHSCVCPDGTPGGHYPSKEQIPGVAEPAVTRFTLLRFDDEPR
ncbi:MAG: hypothetical protein ACKN9D_11055, partial [Actinomycetales bacterium]